MRWILLHPCGYSASEVRDAGPFPVFSLVRETAQPLKPKLASVKTVPLADAEAAVRSAQEKVQAPGANPKYGPGSTNFNILTDNCTTFAAEIASKGGVMTPATFPTLTWHFFEANLSGARRRMGALR